MFKLKSIAVLLFSINAFAQQNPYASLSYDSLVIYDFEYLDYSVKPRKRIMSIIDENGKLPNTIKKSVRLPAKEAKELSDKIGLKSSYGQITAACFDPHFGMVYYENGKPKEHVTICLTCNFPRSSLEIPTRDQGGEKMDNGEMYYTLEGFSKSFRQYLNDIKKKYDFSAQLVKSDMFD
ncbi:MAG: hypothetical protein GY816_17585 [Cytophagales bacterium]|nr:hypothetical protein [Cytophagales bacterium]